MVRDLARAAWLGSRPWLPWAAAAMALAWAFVLRDAGVLYVDTRPDLYLRPGKLVGSCLHSWTSGTSLGAPNFDVGYLPAALAMWGVTSLGAPAWLAMRLWRLLLFVVAAWGAERLARTTFAESWSASGRAVAALAYAATPFALVGAASTPVMLPMALLPWLVMTFRRCLGPGGWRFAPYFAVVFFLMGGINGGVVNLFMCLALPGVLADGLLRRRVGVRQALVGVAAAGLGAVLVSAYWIVATGLAFTSAATVAGTTESPQTIAATSSYAEVVRGLGGWLVYGVDRSGPFSPGTTAYVTNPLVILASFALPLLAIIGVGMRPAPARRWVWGLVLVGAVATVGMYPSGAPTFLGRVVDWAFAEVPGFLAFRTTNKAGPVLVLGLALLAALVVNRLLGRWEWRGQAILMSGLALVWLVALMPAIRADFLANRLQVPSYWTTAATDLSQRSEQQESGASESAAGRVWLIPGETNALYRWRGRGVDDFASQVITRPTFYRRTYPDVPALSANLLAAIDSDLQTRELERGSLSAAARYLGAEDLLVRNDMRWEAVRGARPAHVMAQVERDPGLVASAIYGFPGANVIARGRLGQLPAADREEAQLAPLFRYSVTDPGSLVRTHPQGGHVLIVGDNFGAVELMGTGLLDGTRPFDLMAGLTGEEVLSLVNSGARIVLTDSNRRRGANDRTLDRSGPLLPGGVDPGPTRALFGAADQTVAEYGSVSAVVASSSGSIFGPESTGRVGLAFDGDPTTAWQFGDFGTGEGESVTIDFGVRRTVHEVRLTALDTFPERLVRMRVQAGTAVVSLDVLGDEVVARFPEGTRAQRVVITAAQVTGGGVNQVGVAEIEVDDVDLVERARLPLTLDRLSAADPDLAAALSQTGIDVLLTRQTSLESERDLRRRFGLPVSRSYAVSGTISGVRAHREHRREEAASHRGSKRSCLSIGTLDSVSVRVRLGRRHSDDTADFTGCGAGPTLSAGEHDFVPLEGVTIDRLSLVDAQHPTSVGLSTAPAVESWTGDPTSFEIEVAASTRPYLLVLAQSYDARWSARTAGVSLGEPVVADGYALAWWVQPGPARTIEVSYGPQRPYEAALWVSLATLIVAVSWLLLGAVQRGRNRWN